MFAEKHYPDMIAPEELDTYLAKGWYRMGQTIFTTHFLCFGSQFYSAIWIRLDLQDYKFRKSLRKLLRKNDAFLRTAYGEAQITPQREALYQKYKREFPGVIAPSLLAKLLVTHFIQFVKTWVHPSFHWAFTQQLGTE